MKGLYQILLGSDLIAPVADMLRNGQLVMEPNGQVKSKSVVVPDRAWVFARLCPERQCDKNFSIYFERYKFIPRQCRQCKKIVLELDTLEELMKVMKLQKELNRPSKCGIEKRRFTGNLGKYYAFWYCELGAKWVGARAYFGQVKEQVKTIIDQPRMILKRGCTEMERDFYPSSSWDELAKKREWDKMQDELDKYFLDAELIEKELPMLALHNQRKWIEYAFEYGDETYLKFTERPFKLPVETYHDD